MQISNLTLCVTRPSCQFCETLDEFGKPWTGFKTGLTHSWLYSIRLEKRLIEIIQTAQTSRFSAGTVTSRTQAPHGTRSRCSPPRTPASIQHHIKNQQRSGRPDSHRFRTDLGSPPHAFVLLQLQLLMVAGGGKISVSAGTELAKTLTVGAMRRAQSEYMLVRDNSVAWSWPNRSGPRGCTETSTSWIPHCGSKDHHNMTAVVPHTLLDGSGTWQITPVSHYLTFVMIVSTGGEPGKASTVMKKKGNEEK